jgi:hypothetical protein
MKKMLEICFGRGDKIKKVRLLLKNFCGNSKRQ